MARIKNNLNDYLDLNMRYLNLTGIFEKNGDEIHLNIIFDAMLKSNDYKNFLNNIANINISADSLSQYFNDTAFITLFKKLGLQNTQDIKKYKINQDKTKLKNLLQHHFYKTRVIEILRLFETRNDEKIFELIGECKANIPTIFEYIIAISWSYIDNDISRILEANLSLDSNMLPKTHASGGMADFVFFHKNHFVMIEATLTDKINQRRAEMERVSRHLGDLLLKLDSNYKDLSYGIFIAPYLHKNVLNDFRSRINCYYENDSDSISGMRILPLSSNDLIKILESNLGYDDLLARFKKLLDSSNKWGSKWYENEIKRAINSLIS